MLETGIFLSLAIFRMRLAAEDVRFVPAKRYSTVICAPLRLVLRELPSVLAAAALLTGEGVLGRLGGCGAAGLPSCAGGGGELASDPSGSHAPCPLVSAPAAGPRHMYAG